jgi:Flp pilus assembly protein TadD
VTVSAPASTMHYDVLKTLGDCCAELSQYDRARECYGQAAELGPDFPGHQVGLGVVALLEGNAEEASRVFENVIQAQPNCPEAHWGLALAHWHRQSYPQAAQEALTCLRLQPSNRQAILGLFQICRRLGDLLPAAEFVELHLQKHPGDTGLLVCLAEVQSAGGQLAPARQTLLTVLALEPGNAQARQRLVELAEATPPAGGSPATAAFRTDRS